MENKISVLDNILKVIEKINEFLSKYGILSLFKALFAIAIIWIGMTLIFNPDVIFEKYDEWSKKIHSEKVEKTLESHYQIQGHVTDLKWSTSALRCLVLSLHNGQESLSGTYQFLKCSALFEECGDAYSVFDDYQNVHLTQFPIFTYLYSNEMFCGNMEELKKIDNKLYQRLISNDVGYIHIQALIGDGNDVIGFLVLTWEDEPQDHESVHQRIYRNGIRISRLMQ